MVDFAAPVFSTEVDDRIFVNLAQFVLEQLQGGGMYFVTLYTRDGEAQRALMIEAPAVK
jgi:hypothetical protein